MNLKVKKLSGNAKLPIRSTLGAVGYDLFSPEKKTIPPHSRAKIELDIAVEIPEGHYGRIAPRSSLSLKGIDIGGGVIDTDYRGNVGVIVINNTEKDFQINIGEKIAQLILEKVSLLPVFEQKELSNTDRGEGGFGSTGMYLSGDAQLIDTLNKSNKDWVEMCQNAENLLNFRNVKK